MLAFDFWFTTHSRTDSHLILVVPPLVTTFANIILGIVHSHLFLLGINILRVDVCRLRTQVVQKLETNFEGIKSYQARFEQEVKSEQFGRSLTKGSGELFYVKPGKMVWHYNQPEEHWYITNGQIFWDYLPSMKQVMEITLDQAQSYVIAACLGWAVASASLGSESTSPLFRSADFDGASLANAVTRASTWSGGVPPMPTPSPIQSTWFPVLARAARKLARSSRARAEERFRSAMLKAESRTT
jgi:hypothetical protein